MGIKEAFQVEMETEVRREPLHYMTSRYYFTILRIGSCSACVYRGMHARGSFGK